MSSGVTSGPDLTLAALPRGARILRNSSDSVDSSGGTATFDRQARLSVAKEKLREFMEIR
jgi:hypothetical protein